jgi:hypothetical protein
MQSAEFDYSAPVVAQRRVTAVPAFYSRIYRARHIAEVRYRSAQFGTTGVGQ